MNLPVLNEVFLTGSIVSDPETHHVGEHRFPILAFVGETVRNRDGKASKVVKWRAKLFGETARDMSTQLCKGLWVRIRGELSGYTRPTPGSQRLPEIEAREIWVFPPPKVTATINLEETGDVNKEAPSIGA